MVSLQASSHSQDETKPTPNPPEFFSTKKRKWQQGEDQESKRSDDLFMREPKLSKKYEKSNHIDLHLDAPLPLEWERCLDITSGQFHFHNRRTDKRTSKDPRSRREPPSAGPVLDLELNLNLSTSSNFEQSTKHDEEKLGQKSNISKMHNKKSCTTTSTPSWILLDIDDHRQEMVAAVCMRCHMLVMMCKESPSCPNCKFVHPQDHSSSSLLVKPRCKLVLNNI